MKIIDLYKEWIASIKNIHHKQHARLYWWRAVIETLHERAITNDPTPSHKPNQSRIVRSEQFWHKVPDDDLYELRAYLLPYFRREENRGQPLD